MGKLALFFHLYSPCNSCRCFIGRYFWKEFQVEEKKGGLYLVIDYSTTEVFVQYYTIE